jgi:hypothetical protein
LFVVPIDDVVAVFRKATSPKTAKKRTDDSNDEAET